MSVLKLRGLTVQYGGVRACDNVDIDVAERSVCGLIGPNGAGKTSLVDAVTGFTKHSGSVLFRDEEMSGKAPHQLVHRGLARTFQSIELFEDLTVRENLKVGRAAPARWWRSAHGDQTSGLAEHMMAVLEAFDVLPYLDRLPGELSQGQRKRVSIARALVARPSVLILDEPGAGLDSWESRELAEQLRKLADMGIAVLMIDHDMELVLSICSDIYVLEFGKVIAHGSPKQIQSDPRVIAAYLGHDPSAGDPANAAEILT